MATVTKLSKEENIGMGVLTKICTALERHIGDIVELASKGTDFSRQNYF